MLFASTTAYSEVLSCLRKDPRVWQGQAISTNLLQRIDGCLGQRDGEECGKRGAVDSGEQQSVPHPHDEVTSCHVAPGHLRNVILTWNINLTQSCWTALWWGDGYKIVYCWLTHSTSICIEYIYSLSTFYRMYIIVTENHEDDSHQSTHWLWVICPSIPTVFILWWMNWLKRWHFKSGNCIIKY